MSENAIIYGDYCYNLKAVKTHIIAKNINKSLLNDKGLSIGNLLKRLKEKSYLERSKTKWTISKIKGNHMVVLIGS